MTADFTLIDWILLGGTAALALIGLFRGISGELGSLLGLAAGVLAGFLLYGTAQNCAVTFGLGMGSETVLKGATIVIDGALALIVGGLVRILVRKFVSVLVGRTLAAGLGLLSGLVKGILVIGTLTGFGFVQAGPDAEGACVAHSGIVAFIASVSTRLGVGPQS